MKPYACVMAAALACGCGGLQGTRDSNISREVEQSVRDADLRGKESRTMSSLAKLEEALNAYIKTERRIPATLDLLVPKYLAEIPTVELSIHRDGDHVQNYESRILRDGQIDGSQLKDTGRWGYVHNDRQVVVFIDCTHHSRRKKPWYQERAL